MKVETRLSTFVTFDESALGSGPDTLGVEEILETCLNMIQILIVPAFDKFLQNL